MPDNDRPPAPLSAQLEHDRQRAEQEAATLRAEPIELSRGTADALTAERIARDEAAGLRAEKDARREWGLRRRLRWALSRRR